MRRAHVIFYGRVQGVGFRFTAQSLARKFEDISGYVRNTPQGTVELVCEGPEERVKVYLDELKRSMAGNIKDAQVNWEPSTGKFKSFNIRY